MALLFLAAAVLYAVLPATASAGSRIQLKAPAHAKVGRPFDVTLRVVGGARISGFEAELHFDTGAAEFASADYRRSELRKLLGSLHQLGPVELNDGVALGSYSCLTADCAPRGLKATIKGAKGSFVLARVRLTPRVAGRLEIRLGAVELVASDGTRLAAPRGAISSTVGVASAPRVHVAPDTRAPARLSRPSQAHIRDVTGDSRVDEQDVTEVGLQWIVARNDGAVCSTTTVSGPLRRQPRRLPGRLGCAGVCRRGRGPSRGEDRRGSRKSEFRRRFSGRWDRRRPRKRRLPHGGIHVHPPGRHRRGERPIGCQRGRLCDSGQRRADDPVGESATDRDRHERAHDDRRLHATGGESEQQPICVECAAPDRTPGHRLAWDRRAADHQPEQRRQRHLLL